MKISNRIQASGTDAEYDKGSESMKQEVIKCINTSRVIVIVRKLNDEFLIPTAEAMYRGGIRLIEITFDPAGKFSEETTLRQIKLLRSHFDSELHIGAGTVLSPRQAEAAHQAGASFIISPNTDPAVITATKEMGIVSIPGAMTPSEIQQAHVAGADLIKIFPAAELGVDYFRAVLAPLNHIKVIAVGGIDDRNMRSFLDAGAVAVGAGSCIVRRDAIAEGEYNEITLHARRMTEL